jgi:hypothetical protein
MTFHSATRLVSGECEVFVHSSEISSADVMPKIGFWRTAHSASGQYLEFSKRQSGRQLIEDD